MAELEGKVIEKDASQSGFYSYYYMSEKDGARQTTLSVDELRTRAIEALKRAAVWTARNNKPYRFGKIRYWIAKIHLGKGARSEAAEELLYAMMGYAAASPNHPLRYVDFKKEMKLLFDTWASATGQHNLSRAEVAKGIETALKSPTLSKSFDDEFGKDLALQGIANLKKSWPITLRMNAGLAITTCGINTR